MAYAPGSKYVSPDGRVTFDEAGQRLDALGHGTGTYVNTDDLIPMSWLQPQEEQQAQGAKQQAFQRAPGMGTQMTRQPVQQYQPPGTAAQIAPQAPVPPRAGSPWGGFGEIRAQPAQQGPRAQSQYQAPAQQAPQPAGAPSWGGWQAQPEQPQARQRSAWSAWAPPQQAQQPTGPAVTSTYRPPAQQDPNYAPYDYQVQFQQMQPGDTYPFWLQNQIQRAQPPSAPGAAPRYQAPAPPAAPVQQSQPPSYAPYDYQIQFQQMQPGDTYPFWLQNQIGRAQR